MWWHAILPFLCAAKWCEPALLTLEIAPFFSSPFRFLSDRNKDIRKRLFIPRRWTGSPGKWSKHQDRQSSNSVWKMLSGIWWNAWSVLCRAKSWNLRILLGPSQLSISYDSSPLFWERTEWWERPLQTWMGTSWPKNDSNTLEQGCDSNLSLCHLVWQTQ